MKAGFYCFGEQLTYHISSFRFQQAAAESPDDEEEWGEEDDLSVESTDEAEGTMPHRLVSGSHHCKNNFKHFLLFSLDTGLSVNMGGGYDLYCTPPPGGSQDVLASLLWVLKQFFKVMILFMCFRLSDVKAVWSSYSYHESLLITL